MEEQKLLGKETKMEILKIIDQPDGSAILDLEISEEENNMLIQYAVINILKEYIESNERKNK